MYSRVNKIISTSTANDADGGKTITLDQGRQFSIISIYLKITPSDSAGNRVPAIQFRDTDNAVFWEWISDTVLAASTAATFALSPYAPANTGYTDSDALLYQSIPAVIMQGGWNLHYYDRANIDSASDASEIWMLSLIESDLRSVNA